MRHSQFNRELLQNLTEFLVSLEICHRRASICEDNKRLLVCLYERRGTGKIRRSEREKWQDAGYILSSVGPKLVLLREDLGG